MFQLGFYATERKIIEKMKSFGHSGALCVFIILVAGLSAGVEARRLALRPLSVRELRAALRESGLDEDSEVGRSLASALSGITGFALGITKGVGGSILFDVITSNATIAYISNLLNSTSSSSSTTASSGTAQEICFNSRSVDGEAISGRSSRHRDSTDDLIYNDEISSEPEDGERALGSGTGTGTGSSGGVTCIVLNSGVRRRRQLEVRPAEATKTRNRSRRLTKRRVDQRVR